MSDIPRVSTIGHSNHALETFLELLERHAIDVLVDVRRFPGSRTFPWFGSESLANALEQRKKQYVWIEELGGRRPRHPNPPHDNRGLRNQSFQNYADYMSTPEFQAGMRQLMDLAEKHPTAIMCAESVFWRCHRRLVSDYLVSQGGVVEHVFPNGNLKPHTLTPGATVRGGQLSYPGPPTLFD